ncbi:ammonium transporter [Clostridium sp. Mt-5]|uniref:Ammonium transporter n=1 Tax=Clostridium moutaii TaxID=3240932 RepID=A0ABV4BSZ7_9CLOT
MNGINHLWILICACFVFFMQAGFVCYEVGFVQSKNVISVAMENIIAFVVATLSFYFVGFSFMFGISHAGFIGTDNWLLLNLKSNYDYVFVFYQLMFAGTAVTIFSGSMSERTKLKALVIASIVVGAIIYPIYGHWVWGGTYRNQLTFLSRFGYIDYAGATVVHSTAGWIALAGTIIVGARKGRWDENGNPKRLGRSNIPFATLGTFILWFSWFGFNGGNLLKFDDKIGLILLNTNISASAGVVGAVVTTFLIAKDQSFMEAIFNGALGGLVAITAGSDILTPMQAIIVGLITGSVVVLGSLLLLKLKIDDAVNAIPIHAFGGVSGAFLCSLFASPEYLNLPSRIQQIMVQLLGITVNFVWSFGAGLLMFYIINKTIGLRVSNEEEEKGLNIVEFSDVYSWIHYLEEEHYENLTQDLYQKIRQQNIVLKRQANMLVVTQEREREKIARDLHDGVGQSLVALKINLGLIQSKTENEALKGHADRTIKLVENTIEEMRNVIYNIKPVELKRDGLTKSIISLCNKLENLSNIKFNCNIANDLPEWNETEKLNIYRIVQECLTNIIKHSGAAETDINMLTLNNRLLLIRIIDNGRGFAVKNVNSGLGLTAIRERAAMLNAKIMIDSEEGQGTRIILEVPYEKN